MLVLATLVIGVNLCIDLIYAWLDPRVRYRCATGFTYGREMLTLIAPDLLGSVSGVMPGTTPSTDPSQLAGPSTSGASSLTTHTTQTAAGAAATQPAGPYQPSVSSVAHP